MTPRPQRLQPPSRTQGMDCRVCEDSQLVLFTVPDEFRTHAPADSAGICTECLRVTAAKDAVTTAEPDFELVSPSFPGGEAGIAFALALGKLDSLALNRAAIEELLIAAERRGVDIFSTLGRLNAPEAAFGLDRRKQQLSQILD